jgi:hypothetical protein
MFDRKITNKLHQLMDDGTIDARAVADAALIYFSEQDIAEMARVNELLVDEEGMLFDEY